jgi:hypothetical protein
MSNNIPSNGAGWPPPDRQQVPSQSQGQEPGQHSETEVLSNRQEQEADTRRRVAVTVAALVATLGAVIGGVVLTSNSNNGPIGSAVGDSPAAVGGAPGMPSVMPTTSLSVPPLSGLSSAQAVQSAMAAEGTFSPPSSVPANVPTYGGDLAGAVIPSYLTVVIPSVQAKNQTAQSLADQSALFLRAWVAAWESGKVNDPLYSAWCVDRCHEFMDYEINIWRKAGIVPAGTLRFYNLAGGTANGGVSGEVGVCLDDSKMFARTADGRYWGANPYPGDEVLYVFGLVYDKAVGHWVVTEGYTSPGDSYCTDTTS